MSVPMMNKVQLCCAGSATLDGAAKPARDRLAAARRARLARIAARRAAALVLGAVVLAVGAAGWLVISREAPELAMVELPRVVITAKRLPPGTCPVPVEPAAEDCPVPLQDAQAAPAVLATSPSSRSAQR